MVTPAARLLDCRWLGHTGIGTVTEVLLDGLAEVPPPGRWVLWGPPSLHNRAWPGAEVVVATHPPLALAGQRDSFAVPPADHSFFLHVVRPLRAPASLVMVHDTIPLRWGGGAAKRRLWRQYYRRSARAAGAVVVNSDTTWRRVEEDLGVTPVARLDIPIDEGRARRVRALRADALAARPTVLYVGRVRPHKNLGRAVTAFCRSRLVASGALLRIVGADPVGRRLLEPVLRAHPGAPVEVVDRCGDEALERFYAGATVLVQPSLEEGLGLTVREALSAGIPVCCSAGGALEESSGGLATTFDPWSEEAIGAALETAVERAMAGWRPPPLVGPSPQDLAASVLALPW